MQRLLRTSLDHSVLQNDQGRRDKQELKRSDETTAPLWIAYDSVFCGPLIFDPPKYCVINGLELAHYWKKSNCIITYCVGGSFIGHVLIVVYVVVCTYLVCQHVIFFFSFRPIYSLRVSFLSLHPIN